MYRDGDGVNEDKVTALMWFEIYLANEFELKNVARFLIDRAEQELDTAEITEAQEMASECMSSGYTDCGY